MATPPWPRPFTFSFTFPYPAPPLRELSLVNASGNLSDITVFFFGMTYCCSLRLCSLIWVTCRSCSFPDIVALSCCAGAGCLGHLGWLHTYEVDTEHHANSNLIAVVAKWWFCDTELCVQSSPQP